ncbi:tRNA 5-methoxyuridine(34)/uridine 5-oxyacetic acid(34) synthase CmoB [Hydrogenovibrio halophilus]|uniref:tRNA 5-methoxyuridine(34)/uridine 5-oxyacetic acid(34) synthase CmoB n=1 Tax=Hydrogenovibrio halophilus TaxID=373391 RepID=UPI00036B6367|nr:tRNA 5-methoxyuridine(34)/uridine 5-oxyacetic acid(34) synthase CmoB [Hydrogenovibrio halophilus]
MKHFWQDYHTFWPALEDANLPHWQEALKPRLEIALDPQANGNLPRWLPALESIHRLPGSEHAVLDQPVVQAWSKTPFVDPDELTQTLKALMPWRKGPFEIEGVYIDTEWRSDLKWARVAPHLSDLTNRRVLDIGCGSGYHLWRMLGAGARFAVGVDPGLQFMAQFLAMKHFLGPDLPAWFLPLTLEQLPLRQQCQQFDTVFSMGVLYHRRSPIDHLIDLKRHLRPGGELVLETLVVPDDYGQLLVPKDRYAQMNNVWFLPSVSELQRWLEKCGYRNVRCVDVDQTDTNEQRSTDWMQWKSLADFLNPDNPDQTVEGYPAPRRAVLLANTPRG